MNEHRYILEPYKGMNTRYRCPAPNCGKGKTFSRYIDRETGEHIHRSVGRCNRESKCGYHYTPKQYFQDNNISFDTPQPKTHKPKLVTTGPKPEPVFIPVEVFKCTLKGYEQNTFIQNLLYRVPYPFESEDVEQVISMYYLGTIREGDFTGAVTFPFIDANNNVRAVQAKQFDNNNHTTATNWLHSIVEKEHNRNKKPLPEWLEAYKRQDKRVSCLCGEHLLARYPLNPVALVEAPKTAVYGTLYLGFPDNPKNMLCLAVGSLSYLNYERCKTLQGRDVYLFPDLSKDGKAFDTWNRKAKELESLLPGSRFIVSNLLEINASPEEKIKGLDLADYLIRHNWRKYQKNQTKPKVSQIEVDPLEQATPLLTPAEPEDNKLKPTEMNNPSVLTEEDHRIIEQIEREHTTRNRSGNTLCKEAESQKPKSYEELLKENCQLVPGNYLLI